MRTLSVTYLFEKKTKKANKINSSSLDYTRYIFISFLVNWCCVLSRCFLTARVEYNKSLRSICWIIVDECMGPRLFLRWWNWRGFLQWNVGLFINVMADMDKSNFFRELFDVDKVDDNGCE